MNTRKVVIIGDGAVGSTLAYTLFLNKSVNEIAIIDRNIDKVEGDVLDMQHGMSFVEQKKIVVGSYKDIKDAHIVVITAGVGQKEGESRLDLLKRNLLVFDSIIHEMKPYVNKDLIVLVVTNPVDILSYYTYKKLGLPSKQVIGSGTVLDTARLRFAISNETGIDSRNVHTFVIGEHGDSEVAAYSATFVGGLPLTSYCKKCGKCKDNGKEKLSKLHETVKNAAYEIIKKKGATFYAVALAVNRIIETILNDQKSVLTISTYIKEELDGRIKDVYLSLPCVVDATGVNKIIKLDYSLDEQLGLINSFKVLRLQIDQLIK